MSTDFNYSDFEISEIIIDSSIKKINSFAQFNEGWDFGEGKRFENDVIRKAIEINALGRTYQFDSNALPNSNGDIIINLFIKDDFILITIKADSSLYLSHEKGIGEQYEIIYEKENVSIEEISNYLNVISEKCISLERYISKNTTLPEEDLEVIVSRPVRTAQSQFLKRIAPRIQVSQYVNISPNFTKRQLVAQ